MANIQKKLETRNRYRAALTAIRDSICKLNTLHISSDEAKKAGIQQLPMSLDESSEERPIFFTPYRGNIHNLEDLDDPDPSDSYPTYEPDSLIHLNVYSMCLYMNSHMEATRLDYPPGIYYKSCGDFNFGALFECLFTGFHWKVHLTCPALTNFSSWPRSINGPNESLPHMKCLMESEAIGDDRLLRGELIAIIDIMAGRLNTKSLRPHVTLYSVVGPQHLRVLEAYYDGKNLIVRKTKLYDMREYDATTLESLTRWWFGYAAGETKSIKKGATPYPAVQPLYMPGSGK